MNVATLQVQFTAEGVDNVVSGTNQVNSSLEGFASKATSAGQALSLGLTAPLIGFGAIAFKAASDTEESMNKVGVVFGSSATQIQTFASTSATALGISNQAALEATGTIGNLFVAMGTGQEKAAGLSISVVTLASDLASFNNSSPEAALVALQAALIGEYEPMRQFGAALSESSVQAEALRLGLYNGEGQISASARAQAAYSLILQQTTTAQGDFARTSDGAANSMRTAQAELANAAATLGTQLVPVITQAIQMVSSLAERFSGLSPAGQQVVLVVGGIAAAIGPVLVAIGSMATALPVVGAAFSALLGPVGLVIAAIAGLTIAYQTNFLGFADGVKAAVSGISTEFSTLKSSFESGGLGGVIDTLVTQFQGLSQAFADIDWGNLGNTVGTGLHDAIASAAPAVLSAATSLMSDFLNGLQGEGWSGTLAWLNSVPGLIVAAFQFSPGMIAIRALEFIGGFLNGLTGGWASQIVPWLSGLSGQIITSIGNLSFSLLASGIQIISGLLTGITSTWASSVVPALTGIPQGAIDAVGDLSATLFGSGVALLTGMVTGATAAYDAGFVPAMAGIPGGAVAAVGDLSGVLFGAGQSLISGLISGIDSMIGSLTDKLGSVTSLIPNFKGPIDKDRVLLKPAGVAIMGGLIGGISSQVPALTRTLGQVTSGIAGTSLRGVPATVQTGAGVSGRLNTSRSSPSGGGGGTRYYVDLSNAVVGRGAMQEIQRMIAEGSISTYDSRAASTRRAGR